MKKIKYDLINETLYTETLDNGLKVFILPREGYNKTYSIFTTNYGSVDSEFGLDEIKRVPDGIAHFLEHKMFETKDGGDIFSEFVEHGANANAFTSFTQTSYLFSCSENFYPVLGTLLNFVQELTVTEESITKEKGIIEQEIKMYDDNADWRVYFSTIDNMYKENPVKIDIAGTVKSIYEITKGDLEYCFNTFYHPSNMILFVTGNVEPEETIKYIKENQDKKEFSAPREIKRKKVIESHKVDKKESTINLPVSIPHISLGVKEDYSKRFDNIIKYQFCLDIFLNLLLGNNSENYERLTKEEVLNDTFSYSTTFQETFGFAMFSINTHNHEEFISKLKEILLSSANVSFDEKMFQIEKNKIIGSFVSSFNSVESVAKTFTAMHFMNSDLFTVIDTLEDITLEDIKTVANFFTNEESYTIAKVLAKK